MEIPEPNRSNSSNLQKADDVQLTSLEPYTPLQGLPLVQRVEGLAASNPKSLGGEVASAFIVGTLSQMTTDNSDLRRQLESASERTGGLQFELGQAKTRVAVLEERNSAFQRIHTVKQVAIFLGTAMCAVGIDLYKAQIGVSAYVVGGLGIALLIFGGITKLGGDQK